MTDAEILRRAAQINRAKQGPEATEARRQFIAGVNAARVVAPCRCGRTDGSHAAKCPAYWRTEAREARKRAKSESAKEKESKP